MKGTQKPAPVSAEHWTDFPFAVWAEEWGLAGCARAAGCYLMLLVWALKPGQ